MKHCEIRIANRADASVIGDLLAELGYQSDAAAVKQRLNDILDKKAHLIRVACNEVNLVGFVHAFIADRIEANRFIEIGALVVSSACRRQGVASHLLDTVMSWAKQKQITRVCVRSQLQREDAHPFYQQYGFELVKTQHVYQMTP